MGTVWLSTSFAHYYRMGKRFVVYTEQTHHTFKFVNRQGIFSSLLMPMSFTNVKVELCYYLLQQCTRKRDQGNDLWAVCYEFMVHQFYYLYFCPFVHFNHQCHHNHHYLHQHQHHQYFLRRLCTYHYLHCHSHLLHCYHRRLEMDSCQENYVTLFYVYYYLT